MPVFTVSQQFFKIVIQCGGLHETVEEGTYSISGRKLTLSKGKNFYLFRYQMINYLTREKLSINTKTFSTHCNEQWKEPEEEY